VKLELRRFNLSSTETSVNIHQHARLSPCGREFLVARLLRGEPIRAVAASQGVSVRTAYKWLRRFRQEGKPGLLDRSSRPHRSPRRLGRAFRRRIEKLRRRRWSSPRIAQALRVPLSTVVLEVRRLGLAKLKRLEAPVPVVRYESARPGEMLHLDTKKLARILRVGHRIHGDRSQSVEGAGWEFLYVAVDDASRLAYTEILPDEKGETAAAFLLRAAAWLRERGIGLERVMTDNGSGFVSRAFARAGRQLGARHLRTRPYTPRTNGKAERFIQSAMRECGYAQAYGSSDARACAFRRWTRYYNQVRSHMGIHQRTPQQRCRELLVNNVLVNDS
jgi:transposase InsO family protein